MQTNLPSRPAKRQGDKSKATTSTKPGTAKPPATKPGPAKPAAATTAAAKPA
ncbi:hypothetical protein MY10362_009416 [Beauveria mimosiformis]